MEEIRQNFKLDWTKFFNTVSDENFRGCAQHFFKEREICQCMFEGSNEGRKEGRKGREGGREERERKRRRRRERRREKEKERKKEKTISVFIPLISEYSIKCLLKQELPCPQ